MKPEAVRDSSAGQLVRVRTRHWLVEDVQPSPADQWVRLACVDDDAQGDALEVIWKAELDGQVLDAEAWARIGQKGFDDQRPYAAFFHLYLGTEDEWRKQPAALTQSFPRPRDAASYIMDSFPAVKHKREEKFNGAYRTKRIILEIYDALAEATRTGQPYLKRLNPPPPDPTCCHPPKAIR